MTIDYILVTLIAWFVVYIVFIWSRFGILKSISESFYRLEEKKLGVLFTIFCFGLGFILMALVPILGKFMAVSATGALFVGAASRTKSKMAKIVHWAASGLLILGATLSLVCTFNIWFPLGFAILSGLVFVVKPIKNPIWWFELLQIANILFFMTIYLKSLPM